MDSDHDIVMESSSLPPPPVSGPGMSSVRGSSMSVDPERDATPCPDVASSSIGQVQEVSTGTDLFTSTRETQPVSGMVNYKMTQLEEEFSDETDEELNDAASDFSFHEDQALLPRASLTSGLCYDVRMRYHCEVRPESDVHPEDPRRIYYIYKELCKAGLVDDPMSSQPLVKQPLSRIDAREATPEEITMVHTPEHLQFVKSTQHMTEDQLKYLEENRDSIYFNNLTYMSSVLSVGGAIETCRAVVSGKVKNAIGVIRPPGHHAEHDKTMGFCVFNNVCVATKACQKEFGERCRKVLILDWDVHHGNGTQEAFYDDPNVLYMSLHVFRDGTFYPGGDAGDYDHCGEGNGLGRNVNVPWPIQGMGDGDYLYAFQQVIMPIAYEFDPDLVIISAGFDAAAGDELGGCFVTPPCYAHMTRMLMNLAQGKVAVCLEGGYNFRSISKSALAVARTLMGEPPDRLSSTAASNVAVKTVELVKREQSKYWQCLYPKPSPPTFYTHRLHDVLRQYQTKVLYDEYKMTNLYIYRDSLSESFRNEVLATPDYDEKKPLLLIFHDPPEVMGMPNPLTNQMETHNAWMADVVKEYIGWARENGYAVVDVNVPKHFTNETKKEHGEFEPGSDRNHAQKSEGLAKYLWENYIEPNLATEIFFIGVGDAFLGLTSLLINNERVYLKVTGVISFVADNHVRSVASHTNAWLSKWYKDNSMVFVCSEHNMWKGQHKISKRHGKVYQSPKSNLNEMLEYHKHQVFDFIQDRIVEPVEEQENDSQ